ncbi:MAG TPA: penicillin-binding transpeptidase domain-containing protein, partial [Actinoplanes sp.]
DGRPESDVRRRAEAPRQTEPGRAGRRAEAGGNVDGGRRTDGGRGAETGRRAESGRATDIGRRAEAGRSPAGARRTEAGRKPETGRRTAGRPSDTPRKTASRRETPRSRRPEPDDDYDRPAPRRSRAAATSTARSRDAAKPMRAGSPRTAKDEGPRRTASSPRVNRAVRAVASPPPKLASGTRRLRIGSVVALSLFVMIGIRLVVLQVASSPADAARLISLREDRLAQVKLPAARGSILDRDGTVLAHSVEARFVAADPALVKDPAATAATLSPLIGVAQSALIPLLTPHNRPGGGQSRFEYLAQGVDISIGERIAAMDLKGIVVKQDERRDVPGADLAANLIGFTGADNSGLEGLEARYDSLLRGTDGERIFEIGKGDLNKPIPGGYEKYTEPQPGTSLQLTIDGDLQYEVQGILRTQAQKWKATMAGAVVLDARTGQVLAQASYPSYNAAKPQDYSPTEREDVPTSIVADPGSIHKAFIFGAALQEKVITPDSVLAIGPALERGGYVFKDSHRQDKGTKMTMPGLLALSSNVGTILIADKLGKEKVYEYQQKFGLGRATNEGMPGEATGRILPPDEWSESASGSVPIGMSVDATLVQMAAGYAAIANDGVYVQPHLIQSMIAGRDGKVTQAPPPRSHRVLSPEVAAQLRLMLETVVDNADATGNLAAVTGYRVAGKTGTGKRLIDGQYTSA